MTIRCRIGLHRWTPIIRYLIAMEICTDCGKLRAPDIRIDRRSL